jgi:hypothetical protein
MEECGAQAPPERQSAIDPKSAGLGPVPIPGDAAVRGFGESCVMTFPAEIAKHL